MQRRRLGPLARVVFHALNACVDSPADETIIFSSRMGEIQRTQGILEAIAATDPVSPAAFSLSVHNAIAGLWSLVHGVHRPMLALAPASGGPVPALLEAYGHLAERPGSSVTIICYEEPHPSFYAPYIESPSGITAAALRLTPPEKASHVLELSRVKADNASQTQGFLTLVELLHGQCDNSHIFEAGCHWNMKVTA